MDKNILTPIFATVCALAAIFVVYTRSGEWIRNVAMNDCAKISSYSTEDKSGAKVSFPAQDFYWNCLKDKGYFKK